MLSKSITAFLAAVLLVGTQASPAGYSTNIARDPDNSYVNGITKVLNGDGSRYQATEHHPTVPTKQELNDKVQQFHGDMQQAHTNSGANPQHAPGMSSAQHHDDTIHYSSTEKVKPVNGRPGQGAGPSPKYQQTAQQKGCEHRTGGKCSEGGTTGMVTAKHGNDVSMQGDKISSYGTAKRPGQTTGPPVVGHHEGCHGGTGTFGCTDVVSHHGLDDVNKPGRPASPPPRPATPPIPHHQLPTISSAAKQKPPVKKTHKRRRAVAVQAVLERRAAALEELMWLRSL